MISAGNMNAVRSLIQRLGKETQQLVRLAIELAYFSRGSLSYDQILGMSAGEREIALEFINERLEHAKKMPFPVF